MAAALENPRNETRKKLAISAGIVAAAILMVVGWYWSTAAELHKLDVAWAAPPHCSGTTVHNRRLAGKPVVVVAVNPEMRCALEVRILNRGRLTAMLNKLIVPYLGSGTGTMVEAVPVNGIAPRATLDNSIDAEYQIGRPLAPGKTHTVTVAFKYHDSGCMAPGVMGVGDWPWLETSLLGRTVVVTGTDTFAVSSSRQIGGACAD